MRLPAYVNVESRPYDPILYRHGLDKPEKEDDNMKRARMIQVRNTIRWKWTTGDDGKPVRSHRLQSERGTDGRNAKAMPAY
jgi:RNA polymerase-associated protein LEO1